MIRQKCPISSLTSLLLLQTVSMQNVMAKFGVMEVCRRGRISLTLLLLLLLLLRRPWPCRT